MGTNYYAHEGICHCCKRGTKKFHIGKNSHGWQFSFAAHKWEHLSSFAEWKAFLERDDVAIWNEYADVVDKEGFFAMLQEKSPKVPDLKNHTTYCLGSKTVGDREHAQRDCYLDPEGWSFCTSEFS